MDGSKTHRSVWPTVVGAAVLLVVFYVLSIGPVVWVLATLRIGHGHWLERAFAVFYAPLVYASKATGFDDEIVAYVTWVAGP